MQKIYIDLWWCNSKQLVLKRFWDILQFWWDEKQVQEWGMNRDAFYDCMKSLPDRWIFWSSTKIPFPLELYITNVINFKTYSKSEFLIARKILNYVEKFYTNKGMSFKYKITD